MGVQPFKALGQEFLQVEVSLVEHLRSVVSPKANRMVRWEA
jgi:hypothetical protein